MQRTRKAKQRLKKIDECSTRGASDKKKKKKKTPSANAGDVKKCRFSSWVRKIPWRRK